MNNQSCFNCDKKLTSCHGWCVAQGKELTEDEKKDRLSPPVIVIFNSAFVSRDLMQRVYDCNRME